MALAGHEKENIMEQLLKILSELCPGVDFKNETALVDDGLIESLDIVSIVTELMDAFGVEISVEDLSPENFNSAQAMWAMVQRLRS